MSYTTRDKISTNKQVELIGKREFVVAVLDLEHKIFVVHIAALTSVDVGNEMHPLKRDLIAHLKVDKAFTKVLNKYVDFVDVFSRKLASEFLQHTGINNYTIKLIDDQQFSYGLIYSL